MTSSSKNFAADFRRCGKFQNPSVEREVCGTGLGSVNQVPAGQDEPAQGKETTTSAGCTTGVYRNKTVDISTDQLVCVLLKAAGDSYLCGNEKA